MLMVVLCSITSGDQKKNRQNTTATSRNQDGDGQNNELEVSKLYSKNQRAMHVHSQSGEIQYNSSTICKDITPGNKFMRKKKSVFLYICIL